MTGISEKESWSWLLIELEVFPHNELWSWKVTEMKSVLSLKFFLHPKLLLKRPLQEQARLSSLCHQLCCPTTSLHCCSPRLGADNNPRKEREPWGWCSHNIPAPRSLAFSLTVGRESIPPLSQTLALNPKGSTRSHEGPPLATLSEW